MTATDEHTFLFADLSGFTALTEVHGDEDAAELAAGFFEDARALLGEHAASEVKTLGDAMMLRCNSALESIGLALRLVQEVGARHGFLSVRVGLNTGPAVERDGDWFGATVNLAARVSGAAAGGEVLLTGATATAAGVPDGVIEAAKVGDPGAEKARFAAKIFPEPREDEQVVERPGTPRSP